VMGNEWPLHVLYAAGELPEPAPVDILKDLFFWVVE
jgi:hypothetical protein